MMSKWLGVALVLITTTAWSEMRTWTSKNGKTFVGELQSESASKVSLKNKNGKIVKVPIISLSQEDQDYITFNRPINLQIDIGKSVCSTNRNRHCPHVQIQKRGVREISKQLDLYVLVFGKNDTLLVHTRELDIQFSSIDDRVDLYFDSANFLRDSYGSALAMVVDSAQKIVASQATRKKFADPDLQKLLLKSEIWYYIQQQLLDAESQADPTLAFEGVLYDLTKRRSGSGLGTDRETCKRDLTAYTERGFLAAALARFYRSTERVSFSAFTILPTPKVLIYDLFQEPKSSLSKYEAEFPWNCTLSFTRSFKPERDITLRLVGQTDSLLIVGVDKAIVLSTDAKIGGFQSEETTTVIPSVTMQNKAFKSKWITLKKGVPTRITVLLAPNQKSTLSALLFAQEKGIEYLQNEQGGPILPLFATDQLPQQLIDFIYAGVCPTDTKPPEPFIVKGIPNEQTENQDDTD